MRDQLKRALDCVQAEEALKAQTRDYIAHKTRGYRVRPTARPARLAAAAACLLLLLTGAGGWACLTPTSTVSIDVNPSLELNVNRFDRVVSVTGLNEEGEALANTVDVQFLPCVSAVEQVLESQDMAAYLTQDPAVAITVVGNSQNQQERLLNSLENSSVVQNGAYCCALAPEEAQAARQLGLSYGKYAAYLSVQALDPSITPEEIQKMSMREIRALLETLSGRDETPSNGWGNSAGNGFGNGNGNGNGHRYGRTS